ncbi:MAG: SDR family oxidoreductase [Kofleriaceae bacterium]
MSELSGLRALVTGGSSGIGAAIARELAARGCDLVLTARRKEALSEVAASCTGVRVDTVVGDLGKDASASAIWAACTAQGPIDILINNAGFGAFRAFAATEATRDTEMIQLNMTSLVELTKLYLDQQRPRGYIVNIASIGAYQSVPNMALYAATKAFVRNFSEGLHVELRGTGIACTCVCPGGTKTAFHENAGAGDYSWLANASMMTAEAVARTTVKAMLAKKRNVIPGLINKLSCFGVRFVPRSVASWMSQRVLGKPKLALPSRT